jgi:hypothetical protein
MAKVESLGGQRRYLSFYCWGWLTRAIVPMNVKQVLGQVYTVGVH